MATFRDKNRRPQAVAPQLHDIPADLRELRHWVLWRYDWSDDRRAWNKTPYQVNGSMAMSNNPSTWSSFQDVILAWSNAKASYDGIGFVFSAEKGIYGVDLDNCVQDTEGELSLTPLARRVMEILPTYCEISPSGTGLHFICRASDVDAIKTAEVEVYGSGRYFTVTGITWNGTSPVTDCTEPLTRIVQGLQRQREKKRETPDAAPAPVALNVTPDDLLRRAFASANGASLYALYHGNIAGYQDGDEGQSRADQALCSKLAFWSGGDRSLLDQWFRASALMRPKWDKRHSQDGSTYGEMTIDTALSGCREFYNPQSSNRKKEPAAPVLTEEEKTATRRAFSFRFGDLVNSMIEYRHKRLEQEKVDCGWSQINDLYAPVNNALTIVTGYPNSGKSSWMDNLLVNLTRNHGWKHCIISFETQPVELHGLQIASLLQGKSWSLRREDCLSDEEIAIAAEAYQDNFIYHCIPDHDRVMDEVLQYVSDSIHNDGIQGFLFDPWSELNPPEKLVGSMTHFVQGNLAKLREFTVSNHIHTWLVAHPAKLDPKMRKDDSIVPDLYDIADSAHFNNKADYGITVHRHNKGTPDDKTEVRVTKVRRGMPGRLGSVLMKYNLADGSYSELTESGGNDSETVEQYKAAVNRVSIPF